MSGLDAATREALSAALGPDGQLRFDEPMSRHTTLRVGGPVDAWVEPETPEATARVRGECARRGLRSFGVGAGSNLLVRDGGIRGVAICLRRLDDVELIGRDGDVSLVEAGAGASTGRLLAFATRQELGGVEFLGGVPGTVGGGLVMNAGTTLGEFTTVTERVFSLDEAGAAVERSHDECGFGYRSSRIPSTELVLRARLRLPPRPRPAIEADVAELRSRRRAREPHGVPNAGSFFKNPPGAYAGRLIEACGLKGRRVGGAEVSPVHANWLVNAGDARARDFLELIEVVRDVVAAQQHVELELEIKVLGEEAA